jgi:predicted membrane-bound dolichyl-phosphate-mannose-protein mannosyltransferase
LIFQDFRDFYFQLKKAEIAKYTDNLRGKIEQKSGYTAPESVPLAHIINAEHSRPYMEKYLYRQGTGCAKTALCLRTPEASGKAILGE